VEKYRSGNSIVDRDIRAILPCFARLTIAHTAEGFDRAVAETVRGKCRGQSLALEPNLAVRGGGALEGEFGDLSCLDDLRLAEIFQLKRGDPLFLDALNEVLKQRDGDEAIDLQIEVVKARRAFSRPVLQTQAAVRPRQSGPVRDWLSVFLSARSLVGPDRRALYRYRMVDSEYDQAKTILRRLAGSGRLANPDRRAGAIFVSFCAEWFRRESTSTFLRWDNLAPDLFPAVPYSSKQQLTLFGLESGAARSAGARMPVNSFSL